jgi:hypothetical protein
MARVIVVTAATEGGYYSPSKDPSAPIRIYSDRWIEDDFVLRWLGNQRRRNRLTKNEYRRVRKAARENARLGRL